MAESKLFVIIIPVVVFLVSGTFSTTLGKISYSMEAVGNTGKIHAFEKPWFTNWAMFLGMMLLMIPFLIKRLYIVYYKKEEPEEVSRKLYWVIIIPALLDLISTFMMNVGLLWIFPSIWQMLRGSIVIFTAILTVTYRKRSIYSSGWTGVIVVALALVVVACSAFGSTGNDENGDESSSASTSEEKSTATSTLEMIIGIGLVIVAQFLQAFQTIIEEKLLHDIKAPEILIVGMEGIWGFLLCSCVAMPIAYFLPGDEGYGLHEDTIDSFYMVTQNVSLFFILVGYVATILLFNYSGMVITNTTSAMLRNLMEPFRTFFIWIVNVFIFYVFNDETIGEPLSYWSFMELAGFVILSAGFLIYNGTVRLPCLTYKPDDDEIKPLIVNNSEHEESSEVTFA